ncbi:hypothetical protein BDZ97DRAFT_1383890 [Flammula alnicola]|nr:hypothetical protein BDZ97DRAFT_1383890 [Flammula alnicola]
MINETSEITTLRPRSVVPPVKRVRFVLPPLQHKSKKRKSRATRSDGLQTTMVYGFRLTIDALDALGAKLYPIPKGCYSMDVSELLDRRTCRAIGFIMTSVRKLTHLNRITFAEVDFGARPYEYVSDDKVLVVGIRRGSRSNFLDEELLAPLTARMADLGFGPPEWYKLLHIV